MGVVSMVCGLGPEMTFWLARTTAALVLEAHANAPPTRGALAGVVRWIPADTVRHEHFAMYDLPA